MRLPPQLRKIHDRFVAWAASQRWLNDYLIAWVTEDDGQEVACIYCTIVRVALIFGFIGFIVGLLV